MSRRKISIRLQDEDLHIYLDYITGPIPNEREYLRRCTVRGLEKRQVKQLSLVFANKNQIQLFEANLQFNHFADAMEILVQLEANKDHMMMMRYLQRLNYAKQLYENNPANNWFASCLSFFGCGNGYPSPQTQISAETPTQMDNVLTVSL